MKFLIYLAALIAVLEAGSLPTPPTPPPPPPFILEQCPAFLPMKKFDITKLYGVWVPNYFVGDFTHCGFLTFSPPLDGNMHDDIVVVNLNDLWTGPVPSESIAEFPLETDGAVFQSGKYQYGGPSDDPPNASIQSLAAAGEFTSQYTVIKTDYDNYALVTTCHDFGDNKLTSVVLFTRTGELNWRLKRKVMRLMLPYGYQMHHFKTVEGCQQKHVYKTISKGAPTA